MYVFDVGGAAAVQRRVYVRWLRQIRRRTGVPIEADCT
jgi:hypothetical protein